MFFKSRIQLVILYLIGYSFSNGLINNFLLVPMNEKTFVKQKKLHFITLALAKETTRSLTNSLLQLQTLEWEDVRRNSQWTSEKVLKDYRFGVSAYSYHLKKTSGIIWAPCVNYLGAGMFWLFLYQWTYGYTWVAIFMHLWMWRCRRPCTKSSLKAF